MIFGELMILQYCKKDSRSPYAQTLSEKQIKPLHTVLLRKALHPHQKTPIHLKKQMFEKAE